MSSEATGRNGNEQAVISNAPGGTPLGHPGTFGDTPTAHGVPAPRAQVPAGLTDTQLRAVELLLCGALPGAVANECGVDRRTLYRWRLECEPFRAELDRGRRAIWAGTIDRMRTLIATSLDVLEEQLYDDYDRSRVRAASIVLTHSCMRKLMQDDGADRGE